jgi:hypothetical protein
MEKINRRGGKRLKREARTPQDELSTNLSLFAEKNEK